MHRPPLIPLLAQSDAGSRPLEFFGTRLVGLTPDNGRKLLLTVGFVVAIVALNRVCRWVARRLLRGHRNERVAFWVRQAISVLFGLILFLSVVSIWFDNPARLATFMGLVTAGVAFALQKPISALAGYVVILRGKTFGVGDRIVMGGVRGDVIALSFTQTTIMEMGQPPPVQGAPPAMWVHARQYTGRVVTVSNSRVFDEPVYNYTRDFPYIWEELQLPISYKDDRRRAEQVLLEATRRNASDVQQIGQQAVDELQRRYGTKPADAAPRVYFRLTDNWLEMTVRFLTTTHGVRDVKDAISRDVIDALDAAGIGIASATFDVVGLPPLTVRLESPDRRDTPP